MFFGFSTSNLIRAVASPDLRLRNGFLFKNFCHHPYVIVSFRNDTYSFDQQTVVQHSRHHTLFCHTLNLLFLLNELPILFLFQQSNMALVRKLWTEVQITTAIKKQSSNYAWGSSFNIRHVKHRQTWA